jgi:BirA family biotin operon repressor/biotin-[acetyl-CoA-carboxylase] ligase
MDEVDSTQDEVHRLAASGAGHGLAVLARLQRTGRGSRGRTWWAPDGGLWLSVLWRRVAGGGVDAPAGDGVALLGIRTSLACAAVIEAACPAARVHLKWPNDLLVHGLKVGGILCEARWQGSLRWVAIGVGLNVQNPLPAETRFPAGTLAVTCPGLEVASLARALAAALARLPGGDTLDEFELEAWRARDWLNGRPIREPLEGIADGITPDGHLAVLSHADGRRHAIVAADSIVL